ncbi:hypothetical protein FQN55_001215 [Onygenales sp. PD_40]|nr:hypothetical protein FQN55_001215 [Onygenales sp. PD_40]KAK2775918.1 hypothetical protein FQN53_002958 [Emmonsiellopsis sp. PD_33]KAK2803271.1 hypothetical protein FQN51_003689 [Onygenales sp. PD_10]
MEPYPMPRDDVQAFSPQPVPSFNNKQRGQKHPRRGKNGPNRFSGHSDAHHNKHGQPQSCFNCGSLQHWAQQCPEPRREFPAGAMKSGRPPKRQKTTGSTSTNFAHDPNYTRGPNPPQRGYTHPPIAHPGYQQIPMAGPGPYGPPTPMSAGPHGPSPWPYEHSPVQYNQPFGPHGLPTPMSAYGSQFPSPSTQASVPPQHAYFPPQYSPQYGEPEYHHRQNSFDPHHQAPSHGGNNRQPRKKWRHSEHVPAIAPPVEPWMEELQSLDIPDSGPSPSEIVWRPANQVSRPLSSILDERDEIGMLPPFVSLPPGMSVSKYILDKGPEEFVSNIKNTEDWPFMMADPIFLEIVTECQLIPVVELIARRKEIFETHRIEPPTLAEEVDDVEDDENPEEEAPEQEGSVIGSDQDHDRMSERHSSQYSPAPSGGSADHYRDDISHPGSGDDDDRYSHRKSASPEPMEYPVSPSTKTDYNDHDYHDHQNSNHPYSKRSGNNHSGPNKWRKHPNGRDQDRDHKPQADGPTHRPNSQGQRGNKRGGFDRRGRGSHFGNNNTRANAKPKQQYNGPPKSKSKKGPNQRGNPSNRGNSGSQNHPNRSSQFGMDGAAEPNLNDNNFQDHQHFQGQPDFQQLNPYESHQSHGEDDAARNNRKRSRRDHSPDRSDDGPRRQEDDITPKIKRRQPHVAEAYSRRW